MARILPFNPLRAPAPDAPAGRSAQPPSAGRRDGEGEPGRIDPERFRALILPHLDSAYSFARYLSRDATLAEDIVQEAFLKAYRAFPGFRGGDPRAWLFAIVRSVFLSWARAKPGWTSAEDAPEAADAAATPEAALVSRSEAETVRGAIEALPEPFRETLVLRELEELSYRQIAETSGVPIGTVMSRLARARQMLVAILREEPAP